MNTISLKDCVIKKRIERISSDLSYEKLNNMLGDPIDFGYFTNGRIGKYDGGSLEITYYHERLTQIALYTLVGDLTFFDKLELTSISTFTLFFDFLNKFGITAENIDTDSYGSSWRLSTGVNVTFYKNELESIQMSFP